MDVTVLEQGSLIILEACCMKKNLTSVEKEIHSILQKGIEDPPSHKEIKKASQLVKNGLFFGLEASSQVAGLAASQTLWGRPQNLLEPLNHISHWTGIRLQNEIFKVMQPQHSYTLIATSGDTHK